MPETIVEQNLNFLSFLDSIGLIIPEKLKDMEDKFSQTENLKLIFEISSYFHSLNASDWFDIASALHSAWLERSHLSKNPNKNSAMLETPKTSATIHSNLKYVETTNEKNTLTTPPPKMNGVKLFENSPFTPDSFALPHKDSNELTLSSRVERLFDILNKTVLQSAFRHMRNNLSVMNQQTRRPLQISPSRSRFDKLYEDHFLHLENQQLRTQFYSLLETREHTFSPKINPKSPKESSCQTPVFDRLSKVKPLPEKLRVMSREYRDLEGATFSPSINQPFDNEEPHRSQSPSARQEKAAQRLYSHAFEKEKKFIAKRMEKHSSELDGCTFVPNTNSSNGNCSTSPERNRALRSRLDESVHRLHTDAARRERDLIVKQGEQELAKFANHTFKPAVNPKKPNKEPVNAHTRLYGDAKKRIEIHKGYEAQMIATDKNRIAKLKPQSSKQQLAQSKSERTLSKIGSLKFQDPAVIDFETSPVNKNDRILADLTPEGSNERQQFAFSSGRSPIATSQSIASKKQIR